MYHSSFNYGITRLTIPQCTESVPQLTLKNVRESSRPECHMFPAASTCNVDESGNLPAFCISPGQSNLAGAGQKLRPGDTAGFASPPHRQLLMRRPEHFPLSLRPTGTLDTRMNALSARARRGVIDH